MCRQRCIICGKKRIRNNHDWEEKYICKFCRKKGQSERKIKKRKRLSRELIEKSKELMKDLNRSPAERIKVVLKNGK